MGAEICSVVAASSATYNKQIEIKIKDNHFYIQKKLIVIIFYVNCTQWFRYNILHIQILNEILNSINFKWNIKTKETSTNKIFSYFYAILASEASCDVVSIFHMSIQIISTMKTIRSCLNSWYMYILTLWLACQLAFD